MTLENKYSPSPVEERSVTFSELLRNLCENYLSKSESVCRQLKALIDQNPDLQTVAAWNALLEKNRNCFSSCLDDCCKMLCESEEKIRLGQLSRSNEQVCEMVSETEARVLSTLTALQRLNSEALQPVFSLKLPALLKNLSGTQKALLREAVSLQTESTQQFSNELQHLAIIQKERNKIITHPLDENHPE